MPKVVDHAVRSAELTDATGRVDGGRVRDVARAAARTSGLVDRED